MALVELARQGYEHHWNKLCSFDEFSESRGRDAAYLGKLIPANLFDDRVKRRSDFQRGLNF